MDAYRERLILSGIGGDGAQVGHHWAFDHDLSELSLQYGECIYSRLGCVDSFYKKYRPEASKGEMGSLDKMATGHLSQMGRYPPTSAQVCRGVSRNELCSCSQLHTRYIFCFLVHVPLYISCLRCRLPAGAAKLNENGVSCLVVVRVFVVPYQTYVMVPFFVQVRGLLAKRGR